MTNLGFQNSIPCIDAAGRLCYRPLPKGWALAYMHTQADAYREMPLLVRSKASVRAVRFFPLMGRVNLLPYIGAWCSLCGWRQSELGDIKHIPSQGCSNNVCVMCRHNVSLSHRGIHWVICGGTTEPVHPDWVRRLRDQCVAAGVPFFFTGWGEWQPLYSRGDWDREIEAGQSYVRNGKPVVAVSRGRHKSAAGELTPQALYGSNVREVSGQWFRRVGSKASGRLLDGREWNEVPREAKQEWR